MKKLDAKSLPDLVRMADTLGLPRIRMDLETGEVDLPTNQILLRQVDAALERKQDARSSLSRKNTAATCDTLPTPAVPPAPCQDLPSTGGPEQMDGPSTGQASASAAPADRPAASE
jgi:hypothetical protein